MNAQRDTSYWLTIKEAVAITGKARATIYQAYSEGKIDGVDGHRNGRAKVLLCPISLAEYDREQPRKKSAPPLPTKYISREKLLAAIEAKLQREALSHEGAARQVGMTRSNFSRKVSNLRNGNLPHGDTLFALLSWLGTPLKDLKA